MEYPPFCFGDNGLTLQELWYIARYYRDTTDSVWWLLMAWCLSGTRASPTIMITLSGWCMALKSSSAKCLITVTSIWAWWHLKSPTSRLFTQPFIQAQMEENIKALRHFVSGIHRWLVNSPHKGPVTWKMFPFDDVIMFRHCQWWCQLTS